MKKILTLFAFVGLVVLQGCTTADDVEYVDNDTISVAYENTNNPYNFTANNNFRVRFNFPVAIFKSDMVLAYRLGGVDNSGRDVWEFLPETYYFDDGTRDFSFNYNFTNLYVDVFLNGNDLGSVSSDYRLAQIFRFVVVPADLVSAVDVNNYKNVIKAFNIKESQIHEIKM